MHRSNVTVLIEQKETASTDRARLLAEQVSQAGFTAEILYRRSNMDILERVAQAAAVGPVALIDSSLVITQSMMNLLLEKAWAESSALVARHTSPAFDTAVRVAHGQIVSSGTELHRVTGPTHAAMGLVRFAPGRDTVKALLNAKAYVQGNLVKLDSVGLLTLILVRANVPVLAIEPTGPCSRVGGESSDELVTIAHHEDDDIKLARAGRTDDGFFATFVVRRLAKPVTRTAIRRGWSAHRVTMLSLALGIAAAALFSAGSRTSLALGAGLAFLSLVLDRVDGDVARYTGTESPLGAWLAGSAERIKEFALYGGLAAGAASRDQRLWGVAMALVALQTARHLVDRNFTAVSEIRETTDLSLPLTQLVDLPSVGPSRLLDRDAALESRPVARWLKRIFELHTGERWLIVCVGAGLGHPRGTLTVLYAWALVALLYVLVRNCLRSATWRRDVTYASCDVIERQADLGVIGSWLMQARPHFATGRFAWAIPAILRGIELGAVTLVGRDQPWAYLWVFAVAFHHHDSMRRALADVAYPRLYVTMGLGFEVRLLLVLVGSKVLPLEVLFFAGGWYFTYVFAVAASLSQARALGARPRRATIR